MFQGNVTIVYVLLVAILIIIAMGIATSLLKRKQHADEIRDNDNYSAYTSNSNLVGKLNNSRLVNKMGGKAKSDPAMQTLFNNAKNPWGVTPTIFKAIRVLFLSVGIFGALFVVVFFKAYQVGFMVILIGGIGWWYPMYYYKAIAREREDEWDKIYEFIWILKNSSMLYDAKKVCLETRDYIQRHYPQHQEIIDGFTDFHEHWQNEEIPEHILKYYNFPIPKELYVILYNMNLTGVPPDQNLDNLRSFALNKHNKLIQKTLSAVPSKATIGTLPFLMLSVVVALLIPMMQTFLKLM